MLQSKHLLATSQCPVARQGSVRHPFRGNVVCLSSSSETCDHKSVDITRLARRDLLLSSCLAVGSVVLSAAVPQQSRAALPATVGSYLPPAGVEDFVEFIPDAKKTPALRAGTVDPNSPYRFALPPTWREAKVANIASGNYCQPRCAEPWTEVIFADDQEGKAQVIVSPLVRLTNKANATIEEIGPPEGVLNSVGPYITGTYLDMEDVVKMTTKRLEDGRMYYFYETNASYGTNGPHALTAATTKGELAVLFVLSATDRQWSKSEKKLRQLLETFRA